MTQDLVNRVKPKWVDSEPVAFASFGSGKPSKTDLPPTLEFPSPNLKVSFPAAICPEWDSGDI